MDRLAGKVAIVTGGGSGIGAATARAFAGEGAQVLLVGRREDALAASVKEIGDAASYLVADASSEDGTQAYVAAAVERYGGLDVLVSNAGVEGPARLVGEHSVEAFDEVLAVNLRGVWLSFKYALPELTRRGGGSVVLMSSSAGLVGYPMLSAYAASKHGVIGLAKSFALEGAPAGIRVNAVCPGFIGTAMVERAAGLMGPALGLTGDQFLGVLRERVPMKRLGTPDEVADLMVFLASQESRYVTGSVHVIDGGVLAGIL